MPEDLPYLRSPSLAAEALAFVADDDLWLATAEGGSARRLTADHAPVTSLRLAPKGSLLAFTSTREGVPEAYILDTAGGPVTRITYWGDRYAGVAGWTDDGRVIALSAVGEPFGVRRWAYAIPPGGGRPERLPYGPISGISFGPGGAVVLGVNQGRHSGAAWKRYRGGTAAALWIDTEGDGSFSPYLAELSGQLEDPHFAGERVVFVSDHEGTGNVYSALPDGSDLRRHTDHSDFYARAASCDARRVVYQSAGALWRLDDLSSGSRPVQLEIRLEGPRSGRAARRLKAADEWGEAAPDHSARASAVEARGRIYWLTHREGPARLLAGSSGVRARLPRLAGKGAATTIAFVTDATGEDAIEIASLTGPHTGTEPPRRLGAGEIGAVVALAGAPDGRHVAVAAHDGRVILLDLVSGELRTIGESVAGVATGLTFSPDSRWLAWSQAGPTPLRHIKLARVDGGEVVDATPLRFEDRDPAFTLDGRYLAFLSVRTFDPVYDAHVLDMSFVSAARPFLLTLAASTPSPFGAELEGRARAQAEGARVQADDADGAYGQDGVERPNVDGGYGGLLGELEPAQVDLDGIAERVVPFPVAAGRYSGLRAAAGGLIWLTEPLLGVLGEERASLRADKERPKLIRYDLAKRAEIELLGAADAFRVSGDGRSVVVRDEKKLLVLPADHKVAPGPPGVEDDSQERIDVDLDRIRIELDPPSEWRQMYEEAARLMRDRFWVEDMAGVDWGGVVDRYRPLLDRIATRDDLSELIWEVQGELGSSHAYEMPPERAVAPELRVGSLGADLDRDDDGLWRIGRLIRGESSVPAARSPLSAPGVTVAAGDAVVAIDGRAVDPERGPRSLLVGAAEMPIVLTYRSREDDSVRDVVVEPLADEMPLRYQAWVADRRAVVHAATDGKVGYVHIPDMMGLGWAQLNRDLRLEVAREGLVVDARYNSGGHISELVLEAIERTVRAWDVTRHGLPETYPSKASRGPRVLLINEWAGSDGDIVAAGFRQRGLGPLVGTRTWGGVIGFDDFKRLVDGSAVTQPGLAFWFYGLEWGVENYGVDPDVEVAMAPQDWAAGRDTQLDKAIETILDSLRDVPVSRPPDVATRPSRVPPQLPPRP